LNIEENSINKDKAIKVSTPIVNFEVEEKHVYNFITEPNKTTFFDNEILPNTGWGTDINPYFEPITTDDINVIGLPYEMDYSIIQTSDEQGVLHKYLRIFVKDEFITNPIQIIATIFASVRLKYTITGESCTTNQFTLF
jgi:hypothetical protein